ncbi:toll/interleukin-1 receptor domain-containing protein [Nitrosomonas sp.]|uniref:toll/interleukin-1 receptor domain-containing protein n=1 Tax=Nitrosomonas sp. TaxID=42353 RepID=UPI0026361FD6|nr:toll/interleukin-1 receptor domain-containing protein [Nitrosomonas sp.]MCW5600392.1 toll/interleukin-1 receptor domain-containing protein [Nitrosomonas sp.]
MNERSWDRLLKSIEDGLVVPVLGPQVLIAQGASGSFQAQVAHQLLAYYGYDLKDEILPPFRELNEAVTRLKRDHPLQDLYGDIHDAIEKFTPQNETAIPEPLKHIAAITHFRLFVTLTPDELLAHSLRTRCAVNEIVHSPYLPTSEGSDLPTDWLSRHGEVYLLYLFGKSRPAPMFAIHDEDVLEYVHNIIARGSHVPVKFFGELQQRNLLLIGCNFPEWLSRFFLRLTNQKRLSDTQRKREWLIEAMKPEEELIFFLKSYSEGTEILSDISPSAFIAELYRRWLERNGAEMESIPVQAETVPHNTLFFVSYCRTPDFPAANKLVESLKSLGVADNEIWFDKSAIEPGQDFRERILSGIRTCRYFIPLISSSADQLDEKFFRREWNEALDRSKAIQGRTFIVPVIVDQAYDPEQYQRVPHEWKDTLHFGYAPAGLPDEQTNALLKKLIRAERQRTA